MIRKNQLRAIQVLKETIKTLPEKPGVYRMLDANQKLLYVGKAKNLKARVSSYVKLDDLSERICSMVLQIAQIEIVVTATESEALLLECSLIKNLKPKYNILLKDDKTLPNILIELDHDFPRITKHRGARKAKGYYFGPFPSAGDVKKSIHYLQKIFLVRPCMDSFFATRKRPCIEYEIKRCSAPCVAKISKEDYAKKIALLNKFLSGKDETVRETLISEMEDASARLEFEKAASLRDRIKVLNSVIASTSINIKSILNADIIAVFCSYGIAVIQIFFIRAGLNFGNKVYFPDHVAGAQESEVVESFLMQHYNEDNLPPEEIIVNFFPENKDLLSSYLKNMAGKRVEIKQANSGDRKDLLELVVNNAREALERKVRLKRQDEETFKILAEYFNIKGPIKLIEVYDNSHLFGKQAVGVKIVASLDGFVKNLYRKFNIKATHLSKTGGDDFAMLKEVMLRRMKKILENKEEEPEIMLIDGGKAHLNIVKEVKEKYKLDNITLVSIAKGPNRNAGEEVLYLEDGREINLPVNDPVKLYLQMIRDEAHRFAIETHRKLRAKEIRVSGLDAIPNIGKTRKMALLKHFGSLKAIENAKVEELAKVKNIDHKLATEIFNYLHKNF